MSPAPDARGRVCRAMRRGDTREMGAPNPPEDSTDASVPAASADAPQRRLQAGASTSAADSVDPPQIEARVADAVANLAHERAPEPGPGPLREAPLQRADVRPRELDPQRWQALRPALPAPDGRRIGGALAALAALGALLAVGAGLLVFTATGRHLLPKRLRSHANDFNRVVAAPASARGDPVYYRFTDRNGTTHIVDSLEQVPTALRSRVERLH